MDYVDQVQRLRRLLCFTVRIITLLWFLYCLKHGVFLRSMWVCSVDWCACCSSLLFCITPARRSQDELVLNRSCAALFIVMKGKLLDSANGSITSVLKKLKPAPRQTWYSNVCVAFLQTCYLKICLCKYVYGVRRGGSANFCGVK